MLCLTLFVACAYVSVHMWVPNIVMARALIVGAGSTHIRTYIHTLLYVIIILALLAVE